MHRHCQQDIIVSAKPLHTTAINGNRSEASCGLLASRHCVVNNFGGLLGGVVQVTSACEACCRHDLRQRKPKGMDTRLCKIYLSRPQIFRQQPESAGLAETDHAGRADHAFGTIALQCTTAAALKFTCWRLAALITVLSCDQIAPLEKKRCSPRLVRSKQTEMEGIGQGCLEEPGKCRGYSTEVCPIASSSGMQSSRGPESAPRACLLAAFELVSPRMTAGPFTWPQISRQIHKQASLTNMAADSPLINAS